MSTFSKRLKAARLLAGISQEKLGIELGIDPSSASARMNRYEVGARVPDLELVERMGAVLGVPAAYFHAVRDDEAELLLAFHRLSDADRRKVINVAREAAGLPL